jgi:exodeoxyribonuclease V gamma subunit
MYVHRSNRTERLVDVLAEVVARPSADATAPECIVVQGKGMERWLSMQLAQRFGVWANPDFPFPRRLIERAFTAVLGLEGAPSTSFEPETLMWAIANLLPAHLSQPTFAPIQGYLADDERGLKRIALAQRIADTFDQYVVYRPQMVLDWERGGGADWQAVLWRTLVGRYGATHIAARAMAFLNAVPRRPPTDFPQRVCVFGVSTLAPLYLQLLAALAAHVELHLFVLSPSSEYWADIRSRRQLIRAVTRGNADAKELHFVEGHPLLASLGRLGRDFQQVLEATGDYQEPDVDLYHTSGTGSMLATLQSDILRLIHRGRRGDDPTLPRRSDDDSVTVHACHSPMREVEILHDQLLALFDADRTLEPRDVVVMSPAIDAYAPLIDAVFGEAGPHPRIPFRIADRSVRATEEVVEAFASLLTVLRGRMTASDVLDLLSIETIRARFGITVDDLDVLRGWIIEAGIRWGVDDAHRSAAGQPCMIENTWRFGLDRLLLGYAMTGEERTLFRTVLPYDDVEGTAADLLGCLAEFCDALFTLRTDLEQPRPLAAWRDALSSALARMLASTPNTADQHQRIRTTLAELAAHADQAGFGDPVDLDALRAQLDLALQRSASSHGFLAGGVTFCALVPMRTIPFRIVCLLGMNDDAFPRAQRPFGFDLIAQRPQPGDRSPREDDRYLFLEALLSARERLILTYVGQSIRDNSEIPPSVVVSELLDTLDDSFTNEEGQRTLREQLVVRHPLQPFSPRYFRGEDMRLFSYAAGYCDGARALGQTRQTVRPFLTAPLPAPCAAPHAAPSVVTLDELVRFFQHPSRAFAQRRLQLFLGNDARIVADREPMELGSLERWAVGDRLLARTINGEDLDGAFASVRASGALPLGVPGRCTYEELKPEVEVIGRSARALMAGTRLPALEIDAEIGGTRIAGVIRDLWPAGQVRYQFSKLGGAREIGIWICHLLVNLAGPAPRETHSFIVGRRQKDGESMVVRFRPVEDPRALLDELLRLYWLGQTLPLPLFPKASRVYVERLAAKGGAAAAIEAARREFFGNPFVPVPPEAQDKYVQQLFGSRDPLAPTFRFFEDAAPYPSFADVACAVFAPLLAHREDLA